MELQFKNIAFFSYIFCYVHKKAGGKKNANRKDKRKQNKGFTLVEVLIAMTILAIIVAPLLHAFVTASRTNAKAKQLMKATTLAQNVMEELKERYIKAKKRFIGFLKFT